MFRALAVGLLCLPVLILVAKPWTFFWSKPKRATDLTSSPQKLPGRAVVAQNVDEVEKTIPSLLEGTAQPQRLGFSLKVLESSVVKIESTVDGAGLGSGFVVDEHGLVATSFHVLAETASARARFKDGAAFEIEGYAAVDANLDLAIVQLRSPPPNLTAMKLSTLTNPAPLAPVVAIGHPRGVEFSPFDGKVSRILKTSDLPPRSQRFLRRQISGDVDQRWIQHTANIAEGNSGGPLLNEQGEVVGINTWVDREADFGYALQVGYLAELLTHVSDKLVPLEKLAKPDVRMVEMLRQLSVPRLMETYERCKAMRWRPVTDADYDTLQQLAWTITLIQHPKTFAIDALEERSIELRRAADQIVDQLAREKWDSLGQLTLINEHALAQVARPLAGQFFFATFERVCEGDEGTRGVLLRLAGSEQMAFASLTGRWDLPKIGATCLVLGANFEGQFVQYGDNPLKLIRAPVITTRTILPLVGE